MLQVTKRRGLISEYQEHEPVRSCGLQEAGPDTVARVQKQSTAVLIGLFVVNYI